ncbi:YczE/YyaS/YitT family protein [Desulfofalx alkaliphila]|uniref:YczE/YyaS/YitT family protein n=1 Tax=Desulfofalx alkaliphila TaxID=105483 RepID=UPI00068EEE91|nr:membrane protein [Desulfofalx alkaliphila]
MKRSFIFYVVGIILLTLGIVLTIQADLGTSPFDALLVGLFITLGFTIGSWEIIVGLTMVIFNAIAMRKGLEYWALVTSLITGAGIDLWMFLLGGLIQPGTLIMQVVCFGAGMVISGLGIAIYLHSDFAPNPIDRTMLVVSKLTNFNLGISRALINIVLVILAFLFAGPIGIGTLVVAVFSGYIIKFFIPYIDRIEGHFTKKEECTSS